MGMLRVVFGAEYRRRVRTKTFLLTTALVPAAALLALAGVGFVTQSVERDSAAARKQGVAVLDETGTVLAALQQAAADDEDGYRLFPVTEPLAAARAGVRARRHPVLLVLPRGLVGANPAPPISLYVHKDYPTLAQRALRRFVVGAVRSLRLARHDLPPAALAAVRERLDFNVVSVTESGVESSSKQAGQAVATGMAMVIFMVATIYGGGVMQAVMEEKSSRMAEIIVASAGAFELLLGKILAVSAMAATQLAVWLALLVVGGVAVLFAMDFGAAADLAAKELAATPDMSPREEAAQLAGKLPAVRWDVVAVAALMLPLGYLINASLFAALGAMHENPWEAQMSVTLAMLPMLLAIVVAQTMLFMPNSALVVFGAFFPFTAPAILPGWMLLADLPLWQVLASTALCVATTAGMVWLCGRVFRGSLLVYGKKLTWRDLRQILQAD